jgi:hypothetical protein
MGVTQKILVLMQQLEAKLRASGLWAEVNLEEESEYLLRFGVPGEGTPLVVMGDLGVTWEPARAYPTPCYCRISLDDLEATAARLARVARAFADDKLPLGAQEGEGAAEGI